MSHLRALDHPKKQKARLVGQEETRRKEEKWWRKGEEEKREKEGGKAKGFSR